MRQYVIKYMVELNGIKFKYVPINDTKVKCASCGQISNIRDFLSCLEAHSLPLICDTCMSSIDDDQDGTQGN